MAIEDELIAKYAKEAERIYENRTAGDFTWYGVLGDFLRAVDEGRNAPKPKPTETYHIQCRFPGRPGGWEDVFEGYYIDLDEAKAEMARRQAMYTDLEYRIDIRHEG